MQDRHITRGLSLNGLAGTSCWVFESLENYDYPKPQSDFVHGLPTGVSSQMLYATPAVSIFTT